MDVLEPSTEIIHKIINSSAALMNLLKKAGLENLSTISYGGENQGREDAKTFWSYTLTKDLTKMVDCIYTKIEIYKNAFMGIDNLVNAISHELTHVYQINNKLSSSFYNEGYRLFKNENDATKFMQYKMESLAYGEINARSSNIGISIFSILQQDLNELYIKNMLLNIKKY